MAIVAPIVSTFNNRGVREAEGAFGGLRTGLANTFRALGTAAVGIGGIAAVGIGKAITSASDLGEAISANEQIFGDAADQVLRFAEGAAETLGQSTQTVLDGARTFGTFGKAAGLSGDDLADFSTEFSTLASDLGSFYNTDPAEVIEALGAGLRGEAEPLRRFGILMNDASLKQAALEMGIYEGTGALTDQQKILAAQQLIFQQTGDAQGDFARTSDGLANQSRILKARLSNVVAELGQKFLPIASKVAGFVLDKVVPVIEKLVAIFDEEGLAGVLRFVRDRIGEVLPVVQEKLLQAGEALVDWIAPRIGPALEQLGEWIAKLGAWFVEDALPVIVENAETLGRELVAWIGPKIRPALEELGEWIAKLAQWFVDDGLPLLREKLVELGDELVAWIEPRVAPAIVELGKMLGKITAWIVTDAVPKIGVESVKMGVALLKWVDTLGEEAVRGLGKLIVELGDWMVNDGVPKMIEFGTDLGVALRDGFVDLLGKAWTGSSSFARALANNVVSFVNDYVIDPLNGLLEFTIPGPFGSSFTVNAPDIPRIPALAAGGIVDGATLAMIGEAGPEAVVPLDKLDRMTRSETPSITINISGALDPSAVAQQIRTLLQTDARRRGVAVI